MFSKASFSTISLVFILFLRTQVVAQGSGTFTSTFIFNFNVDTAYVQFGQSNPTVQKIANGDTLTVKNGFYHIYLSYPTNEDVYIPQNALRDSTYIFSHNFDLSKKKIDLRSNNASVKYLLGGDVVVLTDWDSEIYIGEKYLNNEFAIFSLDESSLDFRNSVDLIIKNKRFDDRISKIYKKDEVQIEYASFYQKKGGFKAYEVLPGFSYIKEKKYGKMALVLSGLAVSTGLFLHYDNEYSSRLPEYNSIRSLYLEEKNETSAAILGVRMQEKADEVESVNVKRNLALGGIITVVAIDIIDKFRINKRSRKPGRLELDVYIAPKFQKYLTLGAEFKF